MSISLVLHDYEFESHLGHGFLNQQFRQAVTQRPSYQPHSLPVTAAARLLRFRVRIVLRRADHSSRGVLLTVMPQSMNEKIVAHRGQVCGRSPAKIVGFESHPGS
jgi:hypothetical protein